MFGREVLEPEGYGDKACVLVKYRLPLLRHCFILCHEPALASSETSHQELLAFFLSEAERLAMESVGDTQAFMLVYSGSSVRRRPNLHLHVFVVRNRWQKAWVYTVLSAKNFLLILANLLARSDK